MGKSCGICSGEGFEGQDLRAKVLTSKRLGVILYPVLAETSVGIKETGPWRFQPHTVPKHRVGRTNTMSENYNTATKRPHVHADTKLPICAEVAL